jgi:predicted nucleic acid-binding Zn ribbon protein
LQRILLGKQTWKKGSLIKAEQMMKLSQKMEIKNYNNKDKIAKAKEEARRISNGLTKIINKNKSTYRREEFTKWAKEIEDEE